MSQIKVQGNASGTGIFTIASPNSNTDRTLTLPDQTGTVLTNTGPFTANASASAGAVTVDASNNVGIGTSTPAAKFAVSNGGAGGFEFSPTGGINSGTYIQSYNRSTSAYVSSTNYAATHTWYVSSTRAMDIDSSGNLLVGGTDASAWATSRFYVTGGYSQFKYSDAPLLVWNTTNTGTRNLIYFDTTVGAARTDVGSITTNGSTVSYNTSSDYRLKENVRPMVGALARVTALKPCTYTWKTTGVQSEGFIAHELQEVCPDAVTGEKDAVNEDGSIKPQGIDTSFLVATLTAAIQEQQALINDLTARIAALEAK